MKKKEVIKKMGIYSALIGMVSTVGLQLTSPLVAEASVNESSFSEYQKQNDFQSQVNYVKQFVERKSDGTIGLINDISNDLIVQYNLNYLLEHFNYLNTEVRAGRLIINDDLTIEQVGPKANMNFTENHWWGVRHYKNYTNAKSFADQLNVIQTTAGLAALIGFGTLDPALGILATGVDFYCGKLASAIRNVNNNNNKKGVIIDINWALIFSVDSQ